MSHEDLAEVNRRDFVTAAAVGLGMLAVPCCLQNVCAQTTQPSAPPVPFDVGPKGDFSKDGPDMSFEKSHHVILMRQDNKLYVMSSHCTHRGRDLVVQDDHLHCTWHNSDFKFDGTVIKGPARRGGPLSRFAISIDDAGHVIVDKSQEFLDDKWDDPKSFVDLGPGA
jgi:cytochrome b6-f complex iron-sulfur subunit